MAVVAVRDSVGEAITPDIVLRIERARSADSSAVPRSTDSDRGALRL